MSIAPVSGSAAATGLSGLCAAQRQLDTHAHNVANGQTPGFQRQTVVQTAQPTPGGVRSELRQEGAPGGAAGFGGLAKDLVGQRMALYSFEANLRSVQTQDDLLGTLLDTRA